MTSFKIFLIKDRTQTNIKHSPSFLPTLSKEPCRTAHLCFFIKRRDARPSHSGLKKWSENLESNQNSKFRKLFSYSLEDTPINGSQCGDCTHLLEMCKISVHSSRPIDRNCFNLKLTTCESISSIFVRLNTINGGKPRTRTVNLIGVSDLR